MSDVEEAKRNVGTCGVALIRAILLNPTTKQAMIALLTYQKAAIQQTILANLEIIEQLDIASRFLDRLFALVRQEASLIADDIAVMQPILDAFQACPVANVVANGITKIPEYTESLATAALQLITGKKETSGDLNSLAYEAQRRLTLRRAANAVIVQSEKALSLIDDLILLIQEL